jgi:ABC-2 type transport system permease protein
MKALDIAMKDLKQSLRSLFLIGMVIVAPLVITGLLFFAFGGMAFGKTDIPKLYLAVVNLDQPFEGTPPLGDKLVEMVNDESVSSWLSTSPYPDEASARTAVDHQEIGALLLIPADLTQAVYSGGSTQILIVQDPTLSITPSVVRDMVSSFLDGISGARTAITVLNEQTIAYEAKTDPAGVTAITTAFQEWFQDFQTAMFHSPDAALVLRSVADPEDKQTGGLSRFLSLAMVGQMIFFSFFTGAYAMMSILREEEEGTLQRLFTTPTDRTVVLTGKFIAVFLTVTLQTVTLLTIGRIAFNIHWGDPMGVLLAVLAQVTLATGMGVLVISLVRSTRQAGPVLGGVLTFLAMLGGLFTSNIEMPASFTALSRFTPQGWVLENWKILLAGSRMESILVSFLVSIALGILFFIIGAFFFRRRYA